MCTPPIQARLSHAERVDWLRLYRSENVGPATFFRLIERFGSAGRALDALPALARRGGGRRGFVVATRSSAEAELEALSRLGGRMIASIEPEFPTPLKALDTTPLLNTLGDASLLRRDGVGVVGARNASAAGRRMARLLAAELGAGGLVVTSGLARGVDAAAHLGALDSGTVAVLAGGVDVVYPSENRALYEQIRATGCIVSEMAHGMVPQATHFPRRNRLIAGLSLGVVVVEAAARSGSLITARLALDQGREVFAVPGSPFDARSEGPNMLIKQGATLITSAADVIDALGGMRGFSAPPPPPAAPAPPPPDATPPADREVAAARRGIVESLAAAPVAVDELLRQCQLSPAVVSMVLLELELAGRLERHPGNRVSLHP